MGRVWGPWEGCQPSSAPAGLVKQGLHSEKLPDGSSGLPRHQMGGKKNDFFMMCLGMMLHDHELGIYWEQLAHTFDDKHYEAGSLLHKSGFCS